MHYKNGRPAKQGDCVITRDYSGNIIGGVTFGMVAGAETCNCSVAVPIPGGVSTMTCQTTSAMYHAEDAWKAVEEALAENILKAAPPAAPGPNAGTATTPPKTAPQTA